MACPQGRFPEAANGIAAGNAPRVSRRGWVPVDDQQITASDPPTRAGFPMSRTASTGAGSGRRDGGGSLLEGSQAMVGWLVPVEGMVLRMFCRT